MKKKIFILSPILILIVIIIIVYNIETVAVLGYHSFTNKNRVKNNITDNMIMDIDKFEEQLKY